MREWCSHKEFKPRLTKVLQNATPAPYQGEPCVFDDNYNENACLAKESFQNKVFQDLEDELLKPIQNSMAPEVSVDKLSGIGTCLERVARIE